MTTTQIDDRPLPAPRKTVTYEIVEDPDGGVVFLYGNANSSSIAIFCAGYPDDHANGQVFCARLAEENDTLVGLTCLPGYNDLPDKKWQSRKADGYTFDEMACAIRDAVKVVRAESTYEKAKLTGIFHDWGVVPGMIWANRALADEYADSPDELVLFDVLVRMHPHHSKDLPKFEKPSFFSIFVEFYYRIVFALAFACQKNVSKYLGLLSLMIGLLPIKIFPIGPVLSIDDKVVPLCGIPKDAFRRIYMEYPYYQMFKAIFSGKVWETFGDCILPKDLKKTPVLYLYGTQKRVMFHEDPSVYVLQRETQENRSKSNAIAVEDAGHWLYIQQPDICLNEVKKFMSKL